MGKDVGRGLQSRAGCPHADPTGGTRLLQVVQWKDGQVTCLHIFGLLQISLQISCTNLLS